MAGSNGKQMVSAQAAEPVIGKGVNRRSFLQVACGAGAGAVFSQTSAFAELFGFMQPVHVESPLTSYPNRGWEKTYRNLYEPDSTFHFLCAPNDTHNCLLTAYVKNGVVVRIGPSFGFGEAKDTDGNQASHRWDPRCCNKGLSLIRRFYGHRRAKEPMIRKGFREWSDAGHPRDAKTGKVPEQYLNRGQDPFEKITWDQAYEYAAKAMKNISETYSGKSGQEKLVAQGYDPAMAEATREAGTQTLKFRGGMAALGATRLFAQYRNANVMALLDSHIRGVGPDQALGGRGFDNYSWHTDLPPGHPMVTGQQTNDWDLCNVEHSNLIIAWGMNWITTKMPDAHWLTEARIKGAKIVVIATDYSATMCKADEGLIVRPGTTPALALGMCHVLLKEDRADMDYLRRFTDMPLLLRDDTQDLLRAGDVFPGYKNKELKNARILKKGEKIHPLQQPGPVIPEGLRDSWGDYVVFDEKTKNPKAVSRDDMGATFAATGLAPALEGSYTVKLANGEEVTCQPVFAHMKKLIMESYDPRTVSELTWAPVEGIEAIARLIAENNGKTSIAVGMGPNQFFNNDLKDRAQFLLAAMTGNIGKVGGNIGSYAGNYRAAFFSGLGQYIKEDPFNPQLDPDGKISMKGYWKGESVHYWNHGDTVLRKGKALLTGKTHMPTPTKSIHVSNSNSLIGNAKGHFDTVINTLRKCEFVGVNEWWWTSSCEYADIVFAVDAWSEMKVPDATISVTNPFLYIFPDTPLPRAYNTTSDNEVAAGIARAMGKLVGDDRFDKNWAFLEKDNGKTYLRRVLSNSNVSAGYDLEEIIAKAKKGVPVPMLTRTYPKVGGYEQGTEGKPYYTKTGRLEFYREEPEFKDSGESLPIHREPIDSTFYEPNVIVAEAHPLLNPKSPEDYGAKTSDLSADDRQARHVIKPWRELKNTKHPLMKEEGFRFIFHTPKYRHGAHTTGADVDIMAVWFGPFGDMHRKDKRMPYSGEGYADINPLDAKELGIEDGDYIWMDADPNHSPYHGWKPDDEAYKMARLQCRARYYPGTPRGVVKMWHNMAGSTFGTYKGHITRADGLARNSHTGYQSMYRSGSHQSCTRGYLKPTWMTDSLVRKDLIGQTVGTGFAPDVHCPTGAPRESFIKITKKEDGGMNGEGLWSPAKKGLRPTYENEQMKKFIGGDYVEKG
jgi:nitrate reductase alpha subunit